MVLKPQTYYLHFFGKYLYLIHSITAMSLDQRVLILQWNLAGGFGPSDGEPRDMVSLITRILSSPSEFHHIKQWLEYHAHEIAKKIKELGPDIVTLNEVERSLLGVDQLAIILEETGLKHYRYTSCFRIGNHYNNGNAILSKHPFTRTYADTAEVWPLGAVISDGNGMRIGRYVTRASISLDGKVINVYCVHFDDSGDSRIDQAQSLVDITGRRQEGPLLISGDLNIQYTADGFTYGDRDSYDGRAIGIINGAIDHEKLPEGIDLQQTGVIDRSKWSPATYPDCNGGGFAPDRHLDYTLVRRVSHDGVQLFLTSYHSIPTGLSDHTLLLTEGILR